MTAHVPVMTDMTAEPSETPFSEYTNRWEGRYLEERFRLLIAAFEAALRRKPTDGEVFAVVNLLWIIPAAVGMVCFACWAVESDDDPWALAGFAMGLIGQIARVDWLGVVAIYGAPTTIALTAAGVAVQIWSTKRAAMNVASKTSDRVERLWGELADSLQQEDLEGVRRVASMIELADASWVVSRCARLVSNRFPEAVTHLPSLRDLGRVQHNMGKSDAGPAIDADIDFALTHGCTIEGVRVLRNKARKRVRVLWLFTLPLHFIVNVLILAAVLTVLCIAEG